jgi:hypothetical protein
MRQYLAAHGHRIAFFGMVILHALPVIAAAPPLVVIPPLRFFWP